MNRRLIALGSLVMILAGCKHNGNLQVSGTNPVDFGEVLIGMTSAPQTLRWTNAGTQATGIDAVAVRPDTVFQVSGTWQAESVAPGQQSNTVSIAFTPSAVGQVTGEAIPSGLSWAFLAESDQPTIQRAQLQGRGVAQIARGGLTITGGHLVSGQELDLGDVQVGASSQPKIFNVTNTTSNAVSISARWVRNNQGFVVAGPGMSFTIPPGVAMPVVVTFTPPSKNTFTDSLILSDSSGQIMVGTAVKGRGVQEE